MNYILTEYRKIFQNKFFYISLLIMIFISILSALQDLEIFFENYNLQVLIYGDKTYGKKMISLVSSHQYWLGMPISISLYAQFYYFIFPLVIGMSTVDTIYNELKSGNINYYLSRMSRKKYYFGKYLVVFTISMILFIIPILTNIIYINIRTGIWNYSLYTQTIHNIFDSNNPLHIFFTQYENRFQLEFLSRLYINNPYLYGFIMYILGAIFCGLYVSIGLSCSLFIKNRYLVILTPFLIYIGFWIIFSAFKLSHIDPFNILYPAQPVVNITFSSYIINILILFVLTIVFFIVGVLYNENNL